MLLIIFDAEGNRVLFGLRSNQRATGGSNPMKAVISPADVTSSARCPNAYVCQYQGIRIPEDVFGVLVLDEDIQEHDFMLAGVVFTANANDQQVDAIEASLKGFMSALRRSGMMSGGPERDAELPVAHYDSCKVNATIEGKACFNDRLGGIAGLRFLQTGSEMTGLDCAPNTIEGKLTAHNAPGLVVQLEFEVTGNTCSAKTEFVWNFGNREVETTKDGQKIHVYTTSGEHKVLVTPRCVRRTRACSAETQSIKVTALR